MRESPGLKIIQLMEKLGAEVAFHDPHCPRVHRGRQNDFEMLSVPFTPPDAASYDAVIIVTDHRALDYAAIARHAKLLVDTRNATKGPQGANLVRC